LYRSPVVLESLIDSGKHHILLQHYEFAHIFVRKSVPIRWRMRKSNVFKPFLAAQCGKTGIGGGPAGSSVLSTAKMPPVLAHP
jgi:hypothetical protein